MKAATGGLILMSLSHSYACMHAKVLASVANVLLICC